MFSTPLECNAKVFLYNLIFVRFLNKSTLYHRKTNGLTIFNFPASQPHADVGCMLDSAEDIRLRNEILHNEVL